MTLVFGQSPNNIIQPITLTSDGKLEVILNPMINPEIDGTITHLTYGLLRHMTYSNYGFAEILLLNVPLNLGANIVTLPITHSIMGSNPARSAYHAHIYLACDTAGSNALMFHYTCRARWISPT